MELRIANRILPLTQDALSPPKGKLQIYLGIAAVCLVVTVVPQAQEASSEPERRAGFDQVLDENVRDGLVYYRALKGARGRVDAYVASLASVSIATAPREEQIAFWLNAYNALVLQTVINHYPIVQRTSEYPAHSIRQIPGAFEGRVRHVAGRTLSLDQIERDVLAPFHDPRVFMALGRGALGSGRLRSEAYRAELLDRQLTDAAEECATRAQCVQVNRAENTMRVSSIFSWRRDDFIAAYADRLEGFAKRSPIERAVLSFVNARLMPAERDFLMKDGFRMEYLPFDWSLNDLTGQSGGR